MATNHPTVACAELAQMIQSNLLLNLLHGDIVGYFYNYFPCLPPQMTPMKTAFKLPNYFYLHNHETCSMT